MAGGPMVNLVLAFLLFGGVFMLHGPRADDHRRRVSDVRDRGAQEARPRLHRPRDPVRRRKQAGLQAGRPDRLLQRRPDHLLGRSSPTLIRANGDGQAAIVVRPRRPAARRHDQHHRLAARRSLDDPDEVRPGRLPRRRPRPTCCEQPGAGLRGHHDGRLTWDTVKALGHAAGQGLGRRPRPRSALEERAADSPMSVVGASRVAGEVASDQTVPAQRPVRLPAACCSARLNLFVGLFNFIPLLPLDGGHIAGALYEAVRRGVARLLHRPDPGFVDVAKLLPVAYVMAGVILVMSVVLIYADIVAPRSELG